jgi:Family of unknown function (DUF5691)
VTFEDLVTAATVGLTRRPLRIGALGAPAAGHADALDAGDPASALLDAAALLDAGRRAGVQPVRGVTCPAPAEDDGAPELSARAARVLRHVASFDTETLTDLLIAAATAGYRAPAPLLPMLLDSAARARALRPAIAAVLGARGRWLAARRPEWRRMTELAAPPGRRDADRVTAERATADQATAERAIREQRAARAAALITATAPFMPTARGTGPGAGGGAIAEVAGWPGPWPDDLAAAVLAALTRTVMASPRGRLPRELVVAAARKLPVTGSRDYAAELGRVADIDSCPAPWSAMLRRAAEIIGLRRAFFEEIR